MKQRHTNLASRPPAGSKRQLLLLALLGAGLISGCAQDRKTTYPGGFVYLEHREVSGEMALMSRYLHEIDKILLDDSTVSSEQQNRIIAILNQIDTSAGKLATGDIRTNHLVLDEHIDQFKSEVGLALRDASADPPNYFALGRLSGACLACHKHRNP